MIINRQGSKSKIYNKLLPYIPEHKTYIEPFFGAGGLFFNKPRAKTNILNDLNEDVFNLYYCVKYHNEELIEEINKTPICQAVIKHFNNNKMLTKVEKAVRFIFLSNYTLYGEGSTFCINGKRHNYLSNKIVECQQILRDCYIFNKPAINFLSCIHKHYLTNKTFIYCDPPYINTENNYNTPKWLIDKLEELIQKLQSLPCNFAISEFDNDITNDIARRYKLTINIICHRQNIKNRQTEILLTNYNVDKLPMLPLLPPL